MNNSILHGSTGDAMYWLNVAWHGLLLSAAGWLAVKLCLRDARQRCFACMLALVAACIMPWFMQGGFFTRTVPWGAKTGGVEDASQVTWTPAWTIRFGTLEAEEATPGVAAAPAVADEKTSWARFMGKVPAMLLDAAAVMWLAGAVIGTLRALLATRRYRVWCRTLRPLTPHELPVEVGGHIPAELHFFEGRGSPCVVGVLRPVIAVPAEGAASYTLRQWQWVLRHEVEHLRGRDPLISAVFGWLRVLWWWNPFCHAIANQWAQAREEICDAAAAPEGSPQPEYARFLVDVAAHAVNARPGPLMARSTPARRLKSRITALLEGRPVAAKVSRSVMAVLAMVTCLGVVVVQRTGLAQETKEETANAAAPRNDETQKQASDIRLQATIVETDKGIGVVTRTSPVSKETAFVPSQILFQAKFIEAPNALGKPGDILSNAEYEKLLKSVTQRAGIHLFSSPSVTTLNRQRAEVEILRTKKNATEPDPPFVGVRLALEPEIEGAKLKLHAAASVGCLPDKKPERLLDNIPETNAEWDRVKIFTKKETSLLAADEVLVLYLGEIRTGVHMTVFVRATPLRPDGKPAKGFDERVDRKSLERSAAAEDEPKDPVRFALLTARVIVPRGKSKLYAVQPGIGFFPSEPPPETMAPDPGLMHLRSISDLQHRELLRQLNDMEEAEADLPPDRKTVNLAALNPEYMVPEWRKAEFTTSDTVGTLKFRMSGAPSGDLTSVNVRVETERTDADGNPKSSVTNYNLLHGHAELFRELEKVDERGLHYRILLLAAWIEEQ